MTGRVRAWLLRLRGVAPSAGFERDIAEELDHDLALMIADGERAGLSHAEARRQALVRLGGLEQTRQAYRDRRTLPVLEHILQDTRFALRQLRSRPVFAVTAVFMLGLGMAASLAIFSFVDAALLRPLPYQDPARLVWTTEVVERMGPANLSWQDYLDWKREARSFQSFAVWRYAGYLLSSDAGVETAPAIRVSANFLHTLGVSPAYGRDFQESDNLPGGPDVVMLTNGLWQREFGGRPEAVGKTVRLGGVPFTVIGVLPATFEFAPRGALSVLTALRPVPGTCEARRSCHSLNGVARLRDGVTVAAADAEVKRIAGQLERQYPDSNRGQGAMAALLAEEAVGKVRPVLYTLFAASVLLFLIASLNVASLLLARSESRGREFALRSALGATRTRLLRQFAVESLLLIGTGGTLGMAGAVALIRMIFLLVPADMRTRMTFFSSVHCGVHTMAFALIEVVLAGLIFVLVPALRTHVANLRTALTSGTSGGGSLSWRRIGSQLVVLEVATAVVLLVSAGLLSRSLLRLLRVDLGFNPAHLATLQVNAPQNLFGTDAKQLAAQRAIAERFRALPGVTSVGYGTLLPVSFNGNTDWIRFVGKPYNGHHNEVNQRTASPGYFHTLNARLLSGRDFTEDDGADKPRVAIINQTFAETYYPGEDPLGKQFGDTDLSPKSIRQIVGVVDDVHEGALDDDIWPAEYFPVAQDLDQGAVYAVRVDGEPRTVLPAMVAAVRSVSRDLGVADEMTMPDRIRDSQVTALHRGAAWMVGAFAVVALLLASAGLYGVVSYSVSLRNRELGVRMALGSSREAIYGLVLREAGWLSAAGLALGMALAIAAATLLRAVLFQVAAWDVPTLAGSGLLLLCCALLATVLPARRAATVDPVHALRAE